MFLYFSLFFHFRVNLLTPKSKFCSYTFNAPLGLIFLPTVFSGVVNWNHLPQCCRNLGPISLFAESEYSSVLELRFLKYPLISSLWEEKKTESGTMKNGNFFKINLFWLILFVLICYRNKTNSEKCKWTLRSWSLVCHSGSFWCWKKQSSQFDLRFQVSYNLISIIESLLPSSSKYNKGHTERCTLYLQIFILDSKINVDFQLGLRKTWNR